MVNTKYKTENSLIADFLNWTNLNDESFPEYVDFNGNFYSSKDLLFNSDWNWLMEVVEKIESYGFTFEIKKNWARIRKKYENIVLRWEEDKTKIEATYNACIEFIKWYNQQ